MRRAQLLGFQFYMAPADAGGAPGGAASAALNGGGEPGGQPGGGTPSGPPTDDWRASLPDEIKTNAALANHKTVADLAKEHINLQGLIGRKGLIVPNADAPQAEWDKFYEAAGRPKAPDGYEFKKPADLGSYSDEFAKDFREFAHKNGLNAKQAAGLHDWWVEKAKSVGAADAAAKQAAVTQVQQDIIKEWGDKKDEKLALAKRGATVLGFDQATIDGIEAFGGQGGFKVLKGLAEIGNLFKEGELKGGGGAFTMSPADAKAELNRIAAQMSDPKSALMDKNHPEHAGLIQRQLELHRIAAGQSPASGTDVQFKGKV